MQKTLGGDRLGSGNKMQVNLHGFERSTHDLSYIWRSTMASGTLVPFLKQLALPGDTFDIELNCDIKTLPTVGPLFGSYKVQLDVFSVPIRLYNSATHNNMLGIGLKMKDIKLPKVRLFATPIDVDSTRDFDNVQINSSCIFSYLDIRGVGNVGTGEGTQGRKFNAVPWLAYWDIYKNYYANKQEEEGVVLTSSVPGVSETVSFMYWLTPSNAVNEKGGANALYNCDFPALIGYTSVGTIATPDSIVLNFADGSRLLFSEACRDIEFIAPALGFTGKYDYARWGQKFLLNYEYAKLEDVENLPPRLQRFPLEDIDKVREDILRKGVTEEYVINEDSPLMYPYNLATAVKFFDNIDYPVIKGNQEGLAIKTYQSDLFNNWLSSEWLDGPGGINEITAVDTSSGSFNIDALNLSKKVYDMLNRIAVSGGTYDDWINAAYGHDAPNRAQTPVYVGGLSKELVFQEVVSNANAETSEGGQPLGTLAGKGVMSGKHKGGKVVVRVDEPSYIMGLISITPRIDYSQGNMWDVNLDTWDDFHKPNLDAIGFQELITEQMAWWTTKKVVGQDRFIQTSAGKQPAWVNYMTNVNQVRGNFARVDNQMFMTLNRRYDLKEVGDSWEIKDLTTYIDPSKFNFIFAQTSLDSQNFWAQISVDIEGRRKMSAKVMPNL